MQATKAQRYRLLKGSVKIDDETVWNCCGPEIFESAKDGHEVHGMDGLNSPRLVLDTMERRPIVVCDGCCKEAGILW